MTLEEKVKVCSVCKNRKHDIKTGLLCGNTGAKPDFEEKCSDFVIDLAEEERQNKMRAEADEVDNRKSASFGVFIGFILGAVLTVYNVLVVNFSFNDLISLNGIMLCVCIYLGLYAIYAYIEKKSNAIFVAKYFSVFILLLSIPIFTLGNVWNIIYSIAISVGFFLFLTYSKGVNKRIPKETRKPTMLNIIMVILSLLCGILVLKNGAVEHKIVKLCEKTAQSLPADTGMDNYWTDVIPNGDFVEYKYEYKENPAEITYEQKDALQKYSTERLKWMMYDIIKSDSDEIFSSIAKSKQYGLKFKYYTPDGKLYSYVEVPNSEIKRMLSEGGYTTQQSDFISFLDVYNKIIPTIEFFDGCQLCKCTLSQDGKTMHYDLKLYGDTVESLTELTYENMKDQILQVVLPGMLEDLAVGLATMNQMNISFDHTSDVDKSWKLNILIEPHEYNALINQ